MTTDLRALAKMIDHSLLHPAMTDRELIDGCRLALRYDVASVCIKPYAVLLARDLLAGSDVAVGTVIGFPHGSSATAIKLAEAAQALADGAVELDMVVNVGKVLSGDWIAVSDEVRLANELIVDSGGLLKLIFENDFLPEDEHKIRLCRLCNEHGVAFAKTSTGYGFVKQPNGAYRTAGATDHDLRLMRSECWPSVQIKAAGGVRTLDDLLRVRALGATRAGATATAAILDEAARRKSPRQ
jgi:deoxyribose-phosphate aldolase